MLQRKCFKINSYTNYVFLQTTPGTSAKDVVDYIIRKRNLANSFVLNEILFKGALGRCIRLLAPIWQFMLTVFPPPLSAFLSALYCVHMCISMYIFRLCSVYIYVCVGIHAFMAVVSVYMYVRVFIILYPCS